MKQHPFALFVALFAFAALPGAAHALVPTVTVATSCTPSGDAAVTWSVSVSNPTGGAEHSNVHVEVSVDGGPWTLMAIGSLTNANGFAFTGTGVLPEGSLSLRARTIAIGPWSNGLTNERYEYAVLTLVESQATDYAVPTDCEPPPPPPTNPGTGTPGYWKNHAYAWPVDELLLGHIVYTLDQAIDILSTPTAGDVTYIMGRALIAAELNGIIGNDTSCIDVILDDAQAWVDAHPIGSRVRGKDAAWIAGSALASELDAYNNGLLCAPHRD